MTHQHEFVRFADFHHAPAGEPPAHTQVIVLTCACGLYELFPPANDQLCTLAFRTRLTVFMRSLGFAPRDVVEEGRVMVDAGAGHDCAEWSSIGGVCLLCGREVQR